MQDGVIILFLFALGACIGSFLNVVVWRLPRGESLSSPPSHCPNCNERLRWYDNIPVIGWLKLKGKCRFCKQPISPRYPIIETLTGGLFVFYYAMFFMTQTGPCATPPRMLEFGLDWPVYFLYVATVAALLAASLIDAKLFMIPLGLCYFIAAIGFVVHTIVDTPGLPGAVSATPLGAAMAFGGGAGVLLSLLLLKLKIVPLSFPDGELLEIDREFIQKEIDDAKATGGEVPEMPVFLTSSQVRREISKEMLFLIPPMLGAIAAAVIVSQSAGASQLWDRAMTVQPFAAFAGALLGALVGAFVVWIIRILGTLGFGRVAMGLGDAHLMFGVGAVLGAGGATVAFFLAPFFGILFALYRWITGKGHEMPYGPYLSMATCFVMLFYCPIYEYLRPGLEGLAIILSGRMGQ
ncbi:A24 family peptidase [soil metagenome]